MLRLQTLWAAYFTERLCKMNLPNIITMIRIGLVPVFMLLALSGVSDSGLWATIVFVIASITDGIDGYVARKYNMITNFGKFIDPLADKLLVTSAVLIFVEMGIMPAWVAMIIIARDLVVSSLRMVGAAEGRVIQAVFSGKLKTMVHIICVVVLMLNIAPANIQSLLVYLMVAMSIYSGIDYVIKNKDIVKEGATEGGKNENL